MCLVVLIGAFAPRFALFLTWVFGDRLSHAFDSFLIGFAGFLFLPYTTFLYALCHAPNVGVTGFGWVLVAFGVLLDLANWFGGGRTGADRYQSRTA